MKEFRVGILSGDEKLTDFYPDDSYDQPVHWDDKRHLNVTTSICDDHAAERARVYVKKRDCSAAAIDAIGTIKKLKGKPDMPSAVFLNSDGVDDSFPIEDNMDHMAKKFYYSVLRMFIENDDDPAKGWGTSVRELAAYLPDLSKRGSGDDISVAGIIDMDAVKTEPFREALRKAKAEADERRAREKEEREKAVKEAEEARAKAAEEKKAAEEAAAKAEPSARQQLADDPSVQETAEYKRDLEKMDNSNFIFSETVQPSPQKQASEGDSDIPSSDAAYKAQPQTGANVDTLA